MNILVNILANILVNILANILVNTGQRGKERAGDEGDK